MLVRSIYKNLLIGFINPSNFILRTYRGNKLLFSIIDFWGLKLFEKPGVARVPRTVMLHFKYLNINIVINYILSDQSFFWYQISVFKLHLRRTVLFITFFFITVLLPVGLLTVRL